MGETLLRMKPAGWLALTVLLLAIVFLTTKCNAEYDLVPPWTNPALAILAILTASFLAMALASLFVRLRGKLHV
jgi:glucan phosphoethanolaminetransferase (alkaline phosphatase superfamily)